MKIDNVKLANSVRVGNSEKTYFNRFDDRGKEVYDIDLQDHLIKVTDLRSKATKHTSLYNTVSFDVVTDESTKAKPDGATINRTPRASKARDRGDERTD